MSDKEDAGQDNVAPIRKQNSALAERFRQIADDLERGRVRGIFLIAVDEHRRPELKAMVERFSIHEMIGCIEVELFEMKRNVADQSRRG